MAFSHFHLLLTLSLLFLPHISSDLASDRSALLRLRAAVRGHTLRWNSTSSTPCAWEGVTCDNTTNRVVALRLPGDGLSRQLPDNSVGNLTELRALSLRDNSLSGPLPSDLASCTFLQDLHLSGNRFSGEIPASFFTLRNLVRLNLAGNNFSGALSPGFDSLTRLKTLYLENNRFTGPLPDLNSLVDLRQFNVSFNSLNGSIPSSLSTHPSQSFLGTSLCGGPLLPCSNDDRGGNNNPSGGGANKDAGDGNSTLSGGAIAGITAGSVAVLILILAVIFVSWRRHMRSVKITKEHRRIRNHESVVVIEEDSRSIKSLSSEKRAKERFDMASRKDGFVFFSEDVEEFGLRELLSSSAKVMGKGTVGSTYKAYLDSGAEVIVKRLKHVCVSKEEFKVKVEELGSSLHENLAPPKGYFQGRGEKLLIYESFPGGSLSASLHGDTKRQLSWQTRAKIALGTARGISHLHSTTPRAAAHGNIKSSNIFLTTKHDARVSEFGLTRLVSSVPNPVNGYRAPETADSREVSPEADVYSFGILLLELLAGKSPEDFPAEEGNGLADWVQSVVLEKWTIEVFDPDLFGGGGEVDEGPMVQLLHLAVACAAALPDRRPAMAEVTRRIEEICGSEKRDGQ